jgi:hypothetical protein
MVSLSKYGEDFLLLALRINKHINGYVDYFFGPKEIQLHVENETPKSPIQLLKDSDVLLQQLELQNYDKSRKKYLEKLITAMKTSIEILNGEKISMKDQFLKLYDVGLEPANEDELDNLKSEYYEAYSGNGNLEERFKRLEIKRRVPEVKVHEFFTKALDITRNRTKELFINLLPEDEQIHLDLTKEKNKNEIKWTCYEWYLGNYKSRIVVNPKFNMYWTNLLTHSAHEGYPGHHTEFVVKELNLYNKLNQFEHSILFLNSPKLIISEGIADLAINVLFSYRDQVEIGLNEFCLDILNEDPMEKMIGQFKIKHKISLFWYNFAYHALIDNYSKEELLHYGKSNELFGENDLKNQIRTLQDPVYSKTVFTYNLGMKIIKKKYGEFPSIKDFRNLLMNPILPSNLV